MRKLSAVLGNILLVVSLFSISLSPVLAEDSSFSEAELDQMMAPIALYPDSLLAQILMAATYPADVAEAVKWSKDNPKKEGDEAVEAVQDKSWDPSVMSLAAFPQVLGMMGEKPDWVRDVGDAFLADPEKLMDTVQKLRTKARDEGNLETTEQTKVIVEEPSSSETIIIIEPADPQVVYVPAYNPTIIYGTWWWPHYTPWYYYPPGYGFGSAVIRGIGFGIGVRIVNSLWGGVRWGRGRGSVDINVNKYNNINVNRNKIDASRKRSNWKHNSNNRGGVPYRDRKSREQLDRKRGDADKRKDFRGRDSQRENARSALDRRGVSPDQGRKQLQGAGGDKTRESVNRANREAGQGRSGNRETGKTRDTVNRPNRDNAKSTQQRRNSGQSRDHALSGAGNARQSRQSTARGQSSNRSMRSRGGGGGHGGRAGGRHR
ncbi:MAG: DUF3300 domain-containing protein [Gammaproteobacteria bacterium]|nr:DUF3300 domain-containing protein [Gammaproteobacteria bacterium]